MLRHRIVFIIAILLLGLGLLPFRIQIDSFLGAMLFFVGGWIGNYGVISPEKNEFTMKYEDKKINYFLNFGVSPDLDHNMLLNRSFVHSGIFLFGLLVFGTIGNALLLGLAFGWVVHILVDVVHPGEWHLDPFSRIAALGIVFLFLLSAGWLVL